MWSLHAFSTIVHPPGCCWHLWISQPMLLQARPPPVMLAVLICERHLSQLCSLMGLHMETSAILNYTHTTHMCHTWAIPLGTSCSRLNALSMWLDVYIANHATRLRGLWFPVDLLNINVWQALDTEKTDRKTWICFTACNTDVILWSYSAMKASNNPITKKII